MQPLEDSKELVGVLHVETDAIVAYVEDGHIFAFRGSYLDSRPIATACELDGVRKKVGEDLAEQDRVAVHRGHVEDLARNLTIADVPFHPAEGLTRDLGRTDQLRLQRLTAEAREGEKTVDQPAHVLAVVRDQLEIAPGFVVQPLSVVLLHDAGESIDGAKGSAQVMRDAVRE